MGIPILRQGDSIFISDKDKADLLNKHFESVFTRDNSFFFSIPIFYVFYQRQFLHPHPLLPIVLTF